MEKNLEKRATEFALKTHPYEPFFSFWKGAYVEIATEQEEITKREMIDKACALLYDWNKKQAIKYNAKATLSVTEYTINVREFREAMEK